MKIINPKEITLKKRDLKKVFCINFTSNFASIRIVEAYKNNAKQKLTGFISEIFVISLIIQRHTFEYIPKNEQIAIFIISKNAESSL